MKKKKDWYLKYFVIGIFFLLMLIVYQLYSKNTSTPQTEMDCLKLGSNERAAECIKLLRKPKESADFPLSYLEVKDIKAENKGYCIETSGTIKNNYDKAAVYIILRIDFSKEMNGESFHYQTFSPFANINEQIQSGSSKTYTTCLSTQTSSAVKDVSNWVFSIQPYQAKIYEE